MPKFRVRPIPDFDGYAVSESGVVFTCKAPGRRRKGEVAKKGPWKKLSQHPHRFGHMTVTLFKHGKAHPIGVHRLVLLAFVGPCPPGHEARHYPDRDPKNNNLKNLSWATLSVNQKDRVEHGTHNRGERSPTAKLNDQKVREIRKKVAGGRTFRSVADEYGVDMTTVAAIHHRKTWNHVK